MQVANQVVTSILDYYVLQCVLKDIAPQLALNKAAVQRISSLNAEKCGISDSHLCQLWV